jgi:hypothetical protein
MIDDGRHENMKILKATAADAAEIARLNGAVQKMHADHHPDVFKYPADASEIERFFLDSLTDDSHAILVSKRGQSPFI